MKITERYIDPFTDFGFIGIYMIKQDNQDKSKYSAHLLHSENPDSDNISQNICSETTVFCSER